MWVAGDGRVHAEESRPPMSTYGVLATLAWSIAEHRGVTGPGDRDDVYALVRFVDTHIDYVTRHAELAVEVDQALRALLAGMRSVTGAGRRKIGPCPQMVDVAPDGEVHCRCGHQSVQHDNDGAAGDRRCNEPYCGCRAFIPLRNVQPAEPMKVRCDTLLFTSRQLDEDMVTCSGCGHSWDMSRWLTLGDESDLEPSPSDPTR